MKMRWLTFVCAALSLSVQVVAAEGLSCKLEELNGSGGFGYDVSVAVSPNSAQIPRGSFLTGAHCIFKKVQGNPLTDPDRDRQEGYISTSDGPGYRCFVAPNSSSAYSVTLQALVCRGATVPIYPPPQGGSAPISNEGLGGNTVVIAINGRNPSAALPLDYRLCNTTGGAELGIDIAPGKTIRLPFGSCIDTKRPSGLAFRTTETVIINESGYYRAFPAGTFRKTRKVRLRMINEDKLDQRNIPTRVIIGAFMSHTANCHAEQQPGGPILHKSWQGYCELDTIKAGNHYRLCFDKGFTAQGEGKLEYAGSLLPLVLNRASMAEQQPSNYVGVKYQALTYGCRDIFDAQEAFVLIANNNWIGQKVERIVYRMAEINIVH